MLPGDFPSNVIFAVVLIATLVFFGWTLRRLIKVIRLGGPDPRRDRIGKRLSAILVYFFGQRSVLKEPAGIGHFFIFWGFRYFFFTMIYVCNSFDIPMVRDFSDPDVFYII